MSSNIALRDTTENDLPIFFEQQLDVAANYMAAFTAKDPTDLNAFTLHWGKIFKDVEIIKKTILLNEKVAGHVLSFQQFGQPAVSYWLGKEHWNKGVATAALLLFLDHHLETRPLYARAAKDNIASLRVLEKCGFTISGEDKGYSNSRRQDVEEYILKLESK